MGKYYFYAEVTFGWWEKSVFSKAREANVIHADSYAHAAGILDENYGEELISIDKLEAISEEGAAMTLSIDAGRQLRDAALKYDFAEVFERKDYSAPEPREEEPQPAKVTVRVVKEDGPVEMWE